MERREDDLISKKETIQMLRVYADKKFSIGETALAGGIFKAVSYIENNIYGKLRNKEVSEYQKLKEYEDLEEQGRLIKLPCAVGDTLYEPRTDRGIISEYRVNSISSTGERVFIGWQLNSGLYSRLDGIFSDEIGKSVFLTEEQAEKVLQKKEETIKFEDKVPTSWVDNGKENLND